MKLIYKIAVFIFVLVMTGCAGKKALEQERQAALFGGNVIPQQLQEKSGKVDFFYMLKFPAKTFDRSLVVKLTPIVKFNGKTLLLEPVMLQGQAVKTTSFPVVDYRKPFEKTWHYEFTWQPDMDQASVFIKTEAFACGKFRWASEVLVYAKGVTAQVEKAKKADMTGEIRSIVMFPRAKATISSGQSYLKYVRQNLDTVMAYPGAEITSIEILTSCSPDGDFSFNTELGEERYATALRFFDKQLDLKRFAAYWQPGQMTHRTISQNWQGLYDLLEDSQIASRYDLIKQLKALPDAQRERLLVDYMDRYPIIKDEYLPLLRNSQLIILYKMPWHEVKPKVLPGVW